MEVRVVVAPIRGSVEIEQPVRYWITVEAAGCPTTTQTPVIEPPSPVIP